ncbi:hypothetical protein [Micromonospora chersina]|uniref:hypothetical protein n=1 Tax=Micromonospora chersina TaxID=47854 RepID=UPI0033BE8FEB
MNVTTRQIQDHLCTVFHGTDIAYEVANVYVARAAGGYVVAGFVTDGARDRVAAIIRSAFAAEADTVTGRVVAEGTSVHVRIGDVVDAPEQDPAPAAQQADDQAEAVATLGQLAERFVVAAATGDDAAAQLAAVRTVDRVLHHLPAASAWTKATTIVPGLYPSRINGSAWLVGDQLGERRQLAAHHAEDGVVEVAGMRVTDPDALEGLGHHLLAMAERMRAAG